MDQFHRSVDRLVHEFVNYVYTHSGWDLILDLGCNQTVERGRRASGAIGKRGGGAARVGQNIQCARSHHERLTRGRGGWLCRWRQ
jgi:hypothetical protein